VIGIPTALLLGTILLLLLLFVAMRGSMEARKLSSESDLLLLDDQGTADPCSPEFVARIFSPEDWEFVAKAKSPQIETLFRRERKLVALLWVHQTSTAIRRIMREHTQATRQSHDLHFATETKLVLLYAELMLLCGMLFLAIQSAGPQRVRGLAVYADTLSQRLAQAQRDFQTVTAGPKLHGAGSS
jgi:hypothetical protein